VKNENLGKVEKVRFSDFAFDDLDEIFDYTAEFEVEVGKKFIRELMQKFRLLGENPLIGKKMDELIVGIRQFPFKSYNIYYFQTEFGVEIYRVLHSSRDNIQVFDEVIDEAE
jgi:plasmid stabilization system protein ParE